MGEAPRVFANSAAVYDLLYSGKDTVAEATWISQKLKKYGCESPANLLEFGSGTGRHARVFGDMGFHVTGVEPSAEMLERAEAHPKVSYLQGDTATTRTAPSFDAVLALFHVASYHTTLQDLHSFFDTANFHLKNGGLFGFDVWYSPAVHSLLPEERTLKVSNSELSVTRVARPSEDILNSLVTVHYDYAVTDIASGSISRFAEQHEMRHFTQTEVQLLASLHGFELLESAEFMTDGQPARKTWSVWFTLRKR